MTIGLELIFIKKLITGRFMWECLMGLGRLDEARRNAALRQAGLE
jgi:hypothetical protein